MEKLIQLEPNDQPKFLEHLKNLHLAEFQKTEEQTHRKEITTNKEKSNKIIQGKIYTKSTAQMQTTLPPPKNRKFPTKQSSHRSSIRPPKTAKDRQKTFLSKTTQQKPQAPTDKSGKLHMNTKRNTERPGSAFKLPIAKFN